MPYANIKEISIYYEVIGAGKPAVLIAGFNCDSSFWTPVIDLLKSHFQLLVFDNRGSGRSSDPTVPYTVNTMAEDTKELIDVLGIKNPHVVGHSMGGAVAQTMALKYPQHIDKLVLCNSLVKLNAVSGYTNKLLLKMRKEGVPPRRLCETVAPWILSENIVKDSHYLESLIEFQLNYPYQQTNNGFERQLEALLAFDSTTWLEKINKATLVIGSDEDILCPRDAQTLASRISGAKSVTIKGAGHNAILESPQECFEALLNFLT